MNKLKNNCQNEYYVISCKLMLASGVYWTGYVAQNETVIVTVNATTVIPLISVNNWLTIMARDSLNFPLRQSAAAYAAGFGVVTSPNFWLGLTNIYYLTNSAVNGGHNHRLRAEFLTIANMWVTNHESIRFTWVNDTDCGRIKSLNE